MDVKILIEQVLTDLANNRPISSLKDKIRIIAKLLKDSSFIEWIDRELINGYKIEEEVPLYRKCRIIDVKASYLTQVGFGVMQYRDQRIPIENLGKDIFEEFMNIRVLDSIPALEPSHEKNTQLAFTLTPIEMCHVQRILQGCQIQNAYKEIGQQTIEGIINNVRAKLIDIFMDLNETVFEGGLNFVAKEKKSEIRQIINNHGVMSLGNSNLDIEGNNIIIGRNNTVSITSKKKEELNDILDKIENLVSDNNVYDKDIKQTITEVREEVNNKEPNHKYIKMGFRAIKGILTSAATTVTADKMLELTNKAISLLK